MATTGTGDYLAEQVTKEIKKADRRRRKHKWFSVVLWLLASGSTAAIPILLGLRVSAE
jgi:hypothetical protein